MFHIILIKIMPRDEIALKVQSILTKYGSIIKTRVGFHNLTEGDGSNEGMIVLHVSSSDLQKYESLIGELSDLSGVKVRGIEF